MRVLTVCLNPTFQNTLLFSDFKIGEVNRAAEHYLDASGKGMNTARIVSQLGEESMLLTHLGGPRVEEMLSLCKKDKVEILWADSHSEIRTCTTILSDGKATELVKNRIQSTAARGACTKTFQRGNPEKRRSHYLWNAGSRVLTQPLCRLVKEAKERNLFVLLDLKGEDLKRCLPFGVDVIKPNLSEAAQTFLGLTVGEQEDTGELEEKIKPILKQIHQEHHTSTVLSRGSQEYGFSQPSSFVYRLSK
jgi:fructose-1-phosphate kinase PfkB-like protein